jgi:hypothetical protein
MLNKIRTEPEIFAARIDHVVTKKDQDFLKSFHFEGRYRRTKWQQGVSCFGVFLIGVLSEQKVKIHDLGETLSRLLATLFPTVTSQAKNRERVVLLQISTVKFNSALPKDPRKLNSTVISGLWFNKLPSQEKTSKKLRCCSQNTLSHSWKRKNISMINTRNQNFLGMQTQLEIQNFAQSHHHSATDQSNLKLGNKVLTSDREKCCRMIGPPCKKIQRKI